jgi:hypothetical protein
MITTTETVPGVTMIPLEQIRADQNVRQHLDPGGLLHDLGGLGDDGSGVELADDEVDHRDEVAVGPVPAGAAFRGLDQ